MLSVSKCGYNNEYGNQYAFLHSNNDLKVLKTNEMLLTVKGGEHVGELYQWLIAVPASLDIKVNLYYETLKHLFETGNIEENMKLYKKIHQLILPVDENNMAKRMQEFYDYYRKFKVIVPICEVMIRNDSVYIENVWEKSKLELITYAETIEDIFNKNGLSNKLEIVAKEILKTEFIATFCNSLTGGAEAIDISENQDVFGINRNYENAIKFISHEFVIYLLKQQLLNTSAFQNIENFLKHWLYIEGLAEFYLYLLGIGGGFKECQHAIDFYYEVYQKDNTLTAIELFNKAIEKFLK